MLFYGMSTWRDHKDMYQHSYRQDKWGRKFRILDVFKKGWLGPTLAMCVYEDGFVREHEIYAAVFSECDRYEWDR